MMRDSGFTLACIPLVVLLSACGEVKQNGSDRDGRVLRAQAKRQQAACASPTATDRLKNLLFDRAVASHEGDRNNLDTLSDYSLARLEEPVVKGWDAALDITRCHGHLVLEVPPGAERAFAGQRQLEADIDYSAQAAADGNGFVYQMSGTEPIVTKLAAFNLAAQAYRPPAAIDEPSAQASTSAAPVADVAQAPEPRLAASKQPALSQERRTAATILPHATTTQARSEPVLPRPRRSDEVTPAGGSGEQTVRAFYGALARGDGADAAANIVPEKRASRAFSPESMSRFYGRLREPLRLTGISPIGGGAYRVSYRYSAGRSRCDGSAVVSVTTRGGRSYIRSIRATSGC